MNEKLIRNSIIILFTISFFSYRHYKINILDPPPPLVSVEASPTAMIGIDEALVEEVQQSDNMYINWHTGTIHYANKLISTNE